MKSSLNCSRYVLNNWVLSTRSLSPSHHAFTLGSVAKMTVRVSFVLRFSES